MSFIRRKLPPALAGPAILFGITVGIFWKLVLTDQYTWLDNPDFVNQVLPWYQFEAGEWHSGRFPLWDPYHWGGQSLIGQVQPGAAYPLNWILFLLPLRNGWIRQQYLHWYFVLIHYMGALFCYWLCRDLKRSRVASIIAGAAFGSSGYFGGIDWPQMLNGAVWAPVVFLFFLRAMRGDRPVAHTAIAGAALGFSFLSGHHQIPIFVSLAIGGAWIYYWALDEMPRLRIAALAGLFGVFLALTSGLQTLPGYEYGKLVLRWVSAPDPVGWDQKTPYFVHADFSLGPLSIIGIVIPGAHVNTDPFIGLVVVSLAFLGLTGAWRERVVRLFGAIAIGGLVFSLGGNAVFHGVLYSTIPLIEKARSPGMAILVFHLGATVLAAYGLDTFPLEPSEWIWVRRLCWALLALALTLYTGLLGLFLVHPEKAFALPGPPGPAMAALAALMLVTLLYAWRRGQLSTRDARFLVTILMVFEVGGVTGFYYRHRDQAGYFLKRMRENSDIARFLSHQPFPVRVELDREAIPFNWGDWYGIDVFEGYCGVTKNVILLHAQPAFRELFSINYYIGAKPVRDNQVEVFQGASGLKVYRNSGERPRIWVVHEAFRIPSDAAVLEALKRPDFDPRLQTFGIDAPPKLETCGQTDVVRLLAREPNRVRIEANMTCRGLVVVSETFFPGWQARVDGKPAPIYEAYTVLRGVPVDRGLHRIEMLYRPMSVVVGAIMTLSGLLGALLLWILSNRGKRHSDAAGAAQDQQRESGRGQMS